MPARWKASAWAKIDSSSASVGGAAWPGWDASGSSGPFAFDRLLFAMDPGLCRLGKVARAPRWSEDATHGERLGAARRRHRLAPRRAVDLRGGVAVDLLGHAADDSLRDRVRGGEHG